MQQYKFRGKRIDNGQWVYGFYVSSPELPFNESKHFIVEFIGIESGEPIFDWHEVIPETAGMWTGLKDKNGVDVYMGDVIRIKHRNKIDSILGPIVGFVNMDIPYGGMFVDCGDSDYMELGLDKHYIYEILGNRIDNPELLTPAARTA